jgi:Fe-S-cluster-containing hydrogenase component 2
VKVNLAVLTKEYSAERRCVRGKRFLVTNPQQLTNKRVNLGGVIMPSYVITEKCDGCKGQDKTACMYICPNDLMVLDKERMKAYNRDPQMCWE